jgi:hypothetical protein
MCYGACRPVSKYSNIYEGADFLKMEQTKRKSYFTLLSEFAQVARMKRKHVFWRNYITSIWRRQNVKDFTMNSCVLQFVQ